MGFAKMPPAPVAGAKGEQTQVLHVAFLSSSGLCVIPWDLPGGLGMSLSWLRAAVVCVVGSSSRWVAVLGEEKGFLALQLIST